MNPWISRSVAILLDEYDVALVRPGPTDIDEERACLGPALTGPAARAIPGKIEVGDDR